MAPLFSKAMLSSVYTCVVLISLLLMAFWPQNDFHIFILDNDVPLNFPVVFTAVMLAVSYINLRCGRGEMIQQSFPARYVEQEVRTLEEQNNFIAFGLIRFVIHTFLLILPFLPILMFSATLSDISLPMLSKACAVLYSSALLCRLFAFQIYLHFGKWSQIASIMSVGLFLFYFGATVFIAPFSNPLYIIIRFYLGSETVLNSTLQTWTLYALTVTILILIFIAANEIVIRYKMAREN